MDNVECMILLYPPCFQYPKLLHYQLIMTGPIRPSYIFCTNKMLETFKASLYLWTSISKVSPNFEYNSRFKQKQVQKCQTE